MICVSLGQAENHLFQVIITSMNKSPDHQPCLLEVITTSVTDAMAAECGGAHRLELISRFDLGGLTPPLELVRTVVASVRIPVRVMLRDKEDFDVKDESERAQLCAQAGQLATTSIDGLVCGFLRDGDLDEDLLARVINSAPNLRVTFHRAFEDLRNPIAAIQRLKRFPQVDRILTSGTGATIAQRIAQLAACEDTAQPEIAILAGGGMDEEMVRQIRQHTRIREFHLGRGVRQPATIDGVVDAVRVREWLGYLEA